MKRPSQSKSQSIMSISQSKSKPIMSISLSKSVKRPNQSKSQSIMSISLSKSVKRPNQSKSQFIMSISQSKCLLKLFSTILNLITFLLNYLSLSIINSQLSDNHLLNNEIKFRMVQIILSKFQALMFCHKLNPKYKIQNLRESY